MQPFLQNTLSFHNGYLIPQFGLGTFKLINKKQVYEVVTTALKHGYRHIDTAAIYLNQKAIGMAIKNSKIARSEIFITSKIWNWDHKYKKACHAIDKILHDLQVDYIDLLLVHFPTKNRLQCWKAMEEAVQKQQVRSIGISNFSVAQIEELFNFSTIKPVLHQFELHPGLVKQEIINCTQQHNMLVESWGTLMNGECFHEPIILQLAKKYNKNAPQICLKWALQHQFVVIPKSAKPSRVIENTLIDDFELTAEDLKLIAQIKPKRDRWTFSKWMWLK